MAIPNPTQSVGSALNASALRDTVNHVVRTFPAEYVIVEGADSLERMVVLNKPITPEARAIGRDLLLKIDIATGDVTATNEVGELGSYSEQERNQAALNTFAILMQKSISGTLDVAVKAQVDQAKAGHGASLLVNIIKMILAAAMVYYAVKLFLLT